MPSRTTRLGVCPTQTKANRKTPVSYTHLRAHETAANLVCRLLLEKKKKIFLMIRRPPRSTHCISSAASDVYKRQVQDQTKNIKTARCQVEQHGLACAPLKPRQTVNHQLRQDHQNPAPIRKDTLDRARVDFFRCSIKRNHRLVRRARRPVSYTHLTLPTICSV